MGDFAFHPQNYRPLIKCKNVFLLFGDHDGKRSKIEQAGFQGVWDLKQLNFDYRGVSQAILCHWPFEIWPKKHYGSIMLHGHCHLNHRFGIGRCLNVGVDQHNYSPITLHHAIDLILENEEKTGGQKYIHHERAK